MESSPSSLALEELLNNSSKVIEEFQSQCILMAAEFKELTKGNMISDYNYPLFKNEAKRIRFFPTTVTKEVTNISNFLQNELTGFDSLLIEMAKRTRKPLGQSFMKKIRHTFPGTPYKKIRERILFLISQGKIIDHSEEDDAIRNDPSKPNRRGHPKIKDDIPRPQNPSIQTQQQPQQPSSNNKEAENQVNSEHQNPNNESFSNKIDEGAIAAPISNELPKKQSPSTNVVNSDDETNFLEENFENLVSLFSDQGEATDKDLLNEQKKPDKK